MTPGLNHSQRFSTVLNVSQRDPVVRPLIKTKRKDRTSFTNVGIDILFFFSP